MDGWLKLHRSLSDHWIFSFKEPDKALAWIDLLIMARHTGGTVMMKGRALYLERGQIGISQLSLQKKWGWSQNKVKRFLNLLKKHDMCDFKTNDLTTVITICNFDSFQAGERADERPNGRTDERPVERATDDQSNDNIRKKESKERNNEKKTPLPTEVDRQSEDYRFAEWMLSLITDQQPDFKVPNLSNWANTIRLMRERDKRNHRDMGIVWKWVRNDDFWSPNVMSADKFRKQYDRLVAMTNRPSKQNIDEQREAEVNDWINGGQQTFDNYTGGETIDHEPF